MRRIDLNKNAIEPTKWEKCRVTMFSQYHEKYPYRAILVTPSWSINHYQVNHPIYETTGKISDEFIEKWKVDCIERYAKLSKDEAHGTMFAKS